jgi:hypothetical protein
MLNKIYMKKLTLIFIILFSVLFANAQEKKDTLYQLPKVWAIGIKANGGASMVHYNFGSNALFALNNKSQLAYSGGIYFDNILNENESFCFELLFVQLNGLFNLSETTTDTLGNPNGSISQDEYTHLSYISIPLYYKYRISDLSIALGLQVSYMIISSDESKITVIQNDSTSQYNSNSKNLSFSKLDYGPKLMLFYKLSNKVSLNLDYYYGLQNLDQAGASFGISVRNQQLSFGASYKLY